MNLTERNIKLMGRVIWEKMATFRIDASGVNIDFLSYQLLIYRWYFFCLSEVCMKSVHVYRSIQLTKASRMECTIHLNHAVEKFLLGKEPIGLFTFSVIISSILYFTGILLLLLQYFRTSSTLRVSQKNIRYSEEIWLLIQNSNLTVK